MGKAKTSRKRKVFSIDDMPIVSLKPGIRAESHDPKKNLSEQRFIVDALMDCLLDGDVEEFKETLKAHYEAVNITRALKRAGLSKRTFYNALAPDGNPSLETVMKMVSGLQAS